MDIKNILKKIMIKEYFTQMQVMLTFSYAEKFKTSGNFRIIIELNFFMIYC